MSLSGQWTPTASEKAGLAMKYLVVTGGTMSGLGKGTTISSIGRLLLKQALRGFRGLRGFRV